MSQKARPIADISVGGWGSPDLWEKLDELPASDADYVSVANPDADSFEVKLASILAPPWKPGTRKLVVRLRRTSADPVSVRIDFLSGSVIIAQKLLRTAAEITSRFDHSSPYQGAV